jgi:hypothetical protein
VRGRAQRPMAASAGCRRGRGFSALPRLGSLQFVAAGHRLGSRATMRMCRNTSTTCRCAVSLASFFLVFPVLFPFRSAPFLWLLLLPCSVSGVRHIALDLQRRRRRGNEGEMIGETPGDSSITRPRPAQRHFSAAIHPRTCPSLERALWNKMS